jgi:hypothetical protein
VVLESPEVPAVTEEGKLKTGNMAKSASYLFGIIFCILAVCHPSALSQDSVPSAVTGADTVTKAPDGSKHALYAGSGYGSNMIYLGSTISRNQPYGYGSLIYGFNGELYASVSAVHLSGLNPFLSFYIGALSYNHTFNSWFDISAGAYRYEVAQPLADSLFGSFTYGELTLGFDWRLIYTKVSAGGLLSDDNQAYFQLKNSRYFKTPDFFNKKAYIAFDPYINLLFGTLITAETLSETIVSPSGPGRKWNKYNHPPGNTTSYARKSGLMEMDFGIPVSFNTSSFTIETEISYVYPMYDNQYYPDTKGFIFLLSGIFRFF